MNIPEAIHINGNKTYLMGFPSETNQTAALAAAPDSHFLG